MRRELVLPGRSGRGQATGKYLGLPDWVGRSRLGVVSGCSSYESELRGLLSFFFFWREEETGEKMEDERGDGDVRIDRIIDILESEDQSTLSRVSILPLGSK